MLQIRFNHINHLWEIGYFIYSGGGAVWKCVAGTNNRTRAEQLLVDMTTTKVT